MPSDRVCNGTPSSALNVKWIKSSRSNPNGECVEMARLPGGEIAIRNSRDPAGPALVFPRPVVAALIHGIRDGEFADLAGSRR